MKNFKNLPKEVKILVTTAVFTAAIMFIGCIDEIINASFLDAVINCIQIGLIGALIGASALIIYVVAKVITNSDIDNFLQKFSEPIGDYPLDED